MRLRTSAVCDGVGTGANFEIHVRRGDAHLAEENVRESCIVVLAGMDEDRLNLRWRCISRMRGAILGRLGRAPTMLMIFSRVGMKFFRSD